MRSKTIPKRDPFANLNEADLAYCRQAAADDFDHAVRHLRAALELVALAETPDLRLAGTYEVYQPLTKARPLAARRIRLFERARTDDGGAGPLVPASSAARK